MNGEFIRQLSTVARKIFVLCLLHVSLAFGPQTVTSAEDALDTLFENFKTARKLPCGERNTAIRTGKKILELHRDDAANQDVIRFVEKQTTEIIEKDRTCVRNNLYNKLYKDKYWPPFFEVSKHIIAEEGERPLALDVMLTMVSTGYDRIVVDKDDAYVNDTLEYAKIAIRRIEEGKESQSGFWGVFAPFRIKENALGWLNYIIGWINFHKLNQKQEALSYFYKSAQFNWDFRKDGTIYQTIGRYYFDLLADSSGDIYEREADFKKHSAVLRGLADRGLIAFAKAYRAAVGAKAKKERVEAIYRDLSSLYRFRYNLPANERLNGLDEFIRRLSQQPLGDPAAPVEPIFEEPFEVKVNRLKSQ